MQYLSGMKALNVPCSLKTTGDWHLYCFNWDDNKLCDTKDSVFNNYGIEVDKLLPNGKYSNVANHIRACLDMIEQGLFKEVQGMKNDFICTNEYNEEIFSQVYKLHNSPNWKNITEFMLREYKLLWIDYLEMNG